MAYPAKYIPTHDQAKIGLLGLVVGAAFFGVGYLVGKSTENATLSRRRDEVRSAVTLYRKKR